MTEVWDLRGTENQNRIIRDTLARTTFPFEVMVPQLQSEAGKSTIPVEWADLSRYSAEMAEAAESGEHLHVHEDGDKADPVLREVEGRQRVLGLAWYSGKVSMDLSLEGNESLAAEVFLSEGAHMMDFFWMEEHHRTAIWNALHAADVVSVPEAGHVEHEHSWFDHGGYYSWVGEAWMGLFVKAYSDFPVTIRFDHPPTPEAVEEARRALTPFFTGKLSKVYHDRHGGIRPVKYFTTPPSTLRPCRVCKP